jgi:hypothetical protein
MNFSEARKTKGWIVLVATLLGVGIGTFTFISSARANHVYTLTCGIVDYKPGVFFKYCADGGVAVGQIQWDSWSKDGASGRGVYAINDCKPTCVTGKLHRADVRITLTGTTPLTVVNKKSVLNHISITNADKKPLPLGASNTDSWELQ